MNRFLFIDDNPEYLEMVKDICRLKKVNSEIITFADSFEALYYIAKNHQQITAVFTDYHMSDKGVSGKVVAEKCTETRVPVYLVTGDEGINLPSSVKLSKSTSMSAILRIIQLEEVS